MVAEKEARGSLKGANLERVITEQNRETEMFSKYREKEERQG